MREVAVVGGGAAGMMAALSAARCGAKVTLVERNAKLGRKIYITGKGRCNCTNDCTRDEFLDEVPRNPRFLYSALHGLMPQDMMALLTELGCPVKVERGRRVFPVSDKASDVTRALERELRRLGVTILLNTRVTKLLTENGAVIGVKAENGESFPADAVILCTGGVSYPATGSTGDGYRMAEETSHTLVQPKPSLSAFDTADEWPERLQGLTLKNVRLTLKEGHRLRYEEQGELLFTHFGISGPLVLEMSCHLEGDPQDAKVSLCMKPAMSPELIELRVQEVLREQNRRTIANAMHAFLPSRMADLYPDIVGVDGTRQCAQVTREERIRLMDGLHSLPCASAASAPSRKPS